MKKYSGVHKDPLFKLGFKIINAFYFRYSWGLNWIIIWCDFLLYKQINKINK